MLLVLAVLAGFPTPALATTSRPQEPAAEEDGQEEPARQDRAAYPVEPLRASCLGRGCGIFQLVDLRLGTDEETGAEAGFRLQIDERAIIGVSVTEEARSWTLQGSRLSFRYREGEAGREAEGEWLGRRFSLRLAGRERLGLEGDGWLLDGGVGFRLDPELSFRLDFQSDLADDPGFLFGPRPMSTVGAGFLWQRGRRFDLEARLSYGRLRDGTGEPLDRVAVRTRSVWQASDLRLGLELGFVETRGRFDRRTIDGGVDLALRFGSHLLASGSARESVELGVAERARSWSAGLAFFGRRFRFARGGRVGPATLRLSELAWGRGYGLDRAYDTRGLRSLRERLRLAGDPGLAPAVDALYRAQVRDENVPQIGGRWEALRRPDLGWRIDAGKFFVSLPWPLAPPWSRGEARRRFLRLEFDYIEARFGFGRPEVGRRYALVAELNRELVGRIVWDAMARTPLQLAQGKEAVGGLRIDMRYAFGR